jgi:4-hydroxybenzoate polyprenyltransferase
MEPPNTTSVQSYGLRTTDYGPRFKPYAQLLRLPNVFSAVADICLGWVTALAVGTPATRWPIFVFLSFASACLYCAGMVWNDYFDVEQDRRERPFRPIPSGRILRAQAARIGVVLFSAGIVLAALAGSRSDGWTSTPLVVAGILVAAIWAYDAWLKRTPAGPLAMGSCRFLNVLLGLSVIAPADFAWGGRLYLAGVVGVYIVGVTWFARTEAKISDPTSLLSAFLVMLAALAAALAVPVLLSFAEASFLFPYLLVGLGFFVGMPAARAIRKPQPQTVQTGVKRALMGLVILDAILASAIIGTAGLLILLALLPAMYLARWVYMT